MWCASVELGTPDDEEQIDYIASKAAPCSASSCGSSMTTGNIQPRDGKPRASFSARAVGHQALLQG